MHRVAVGVGAGGQFIFVGADHLAAVEAKVLLHLELCSAAAVGLHPRRLHVQMSVPGERGGGAFYIALTLGQCCEASRAMAPPQNAHPVRAQHALVLIRMLRFAMAAVLLAKSFSNISGIFTNVVLFNIQYFACTLDCGSEFLIKLKSISL